MSNNTQPTYHTHISAKHHMLDLNLKEVWKYRDLIVLFTKRSFSLLYKQTILGPAWVFLNPLISSLVYAFVFGGIAGIGTEGVPTVLFYLCSNAIWIFFSTCVTQNATAFTTNAAVFFTDYTDFLCNLCIQTCPCNRKDLLSFRKTGKQFHAFSR